MIPTVQSVVDHLLATIGWGSVIAWCLSSAALFFRLRSKISDAANEWKAARKDLEETKAKVDLALTNHLPHIETYTGTTVAVLQRQNDILDKVNENTTRMVTLLEIRDKN